MHEDIVLTPMMKQFLDLKAKHPDAVMLFRCGDFYETYSTDAVVASEILGITLTKRANGKGKTIEMAGFPHHALDTYLPKLIRAGKRVAICDQLEDPKLTKKLVKRGITELVTPGSLHQRQCAELPGEQLSGCRTLRQGCLRCGFPGHIYGRISDGGRPFRLCGQVAEQLCPPKRCFSSVASG